MANSNIAQRFASPSSPTGQVDDVVRAKPGPQGQAPVFAKKGFVVRRLPGIEESMPFIFLGASALFIAILLEVSGTGIYLGHAPLWIYLVGLGVIALVGGLIAATVDADDPTEPRPGDVVGPGLIAVAHSQWRSLVARHRETGRQAGGSSATSSLTDRARTAGRTAEVEPRREPGPPLVGPSVAASAAPSFPDRPAWSSDTVVQTAFPPQRDLPGSIPDPKMPTTSGWDREYMESDLRGDWSEDPVSVSDTSRTGGMGFAFASSSSSQGRHVGASTTGSVPEMDLSLTNAVRDFQAVIDSAIHPKDEPHRAPVLPKPEPHPFRCIGCESSWADSDPEFRCASCGRGMCAQCVDRCSRQGHAGLCFVCATLLEMNPAEGPENVAASLKDFAK
jgi:hypothetical protein